jgi:hypothetical protein
MMLSTISGGVPPSPYVARNTLKVNHLNVRNPP